MVQKVKIVRTPQSDHIAMCMTLYKNIVKKLIRMNRREYVEKMKKVHILAETVSPRE